MDKPINLNTNFAKNLKKKLAKKPKYYKNQLRRFKRYA